MKIEFEDATKAEAKARIALAGPPGSGKTYTALSLAFGLGKNVVVVDTERGSASKYVGENGWQFKRFNAVSYSPKSLVEILGAASGEGFDVLILDSWSHYWEGTDGMLEQVDRRKSGSNTFSGWKEARPDERRMIDALLSFPGHLIVTLRSKVEYAVEENDRGKKVPVKVGLKPIQRDGVEYEFDVVGDLDLNNTLTISKTRLSSLAKRSIQEPGLELAAEIRAWLEDGLSGLTVGEYREAALAENDPDRLLQLYRDLEGLQLLSAPTVDEHDTPTVLGELVKARGLALREAAKKAPSNPVQEPATPAGEARAALAASLQFKGIAWGDAVNKFLADTGTDLETTEDHVAIKALTQHYRGVK
ncbi:hypothetical protein CH274_13455 [Rhodococcus sp. 06-418-5]|uniref:ATP-binding protein n=1 Tax=Rhodococcus sp. 06-418-5 TaxID=2022507 RepID=UPI000B9A7CD7|nr:ATP-binding protein [Rhodococcus sp. 06-418-5]OZC80236.1 hypothetical protein CH274_13455 [Rhodococcus sp. 06-418-5]